MIPVFLFIICSTAAGQRSSPVLLSRHNQATWIPIGQVSIPRPDNGRQGGHVQQRQDFLRTQRTCPENDWDSDIVSVQQIGMTCEDPLPPGFAPRRNTPRKRKPIAKGAVQESVLNFALKLHAVAIFGGRSKGCRQSVYSPVQEVENLVYSPFSLSNALAVLWRGSGGQTERELASALQFPFGVEPENVNFHEQYEEMLKIILEGNHARDITIDFASAIVGNGGLVVRRSFFEDLKQYYNTLTRTTDLIYNPQIAQEEINEMVRNLTRNKIPNIIQNARQISGAKLILVNAVYFSGTWEYPFDKRYTKLRDFIIKKGRRVQVPMMSQGFEIPFYEGDDFAMVGIPYRGSKEYFMYVVLPYSPHIQGLENLERRLTAEKLLNAIDNARDTEVTLTMPKLDLDSKLNLRSILPGLGICDAFNQEGNFSRISVSRSHEDPLRFHEAIHQAKMMVDEEGTEAAGVSLFTISKSVPSFTANRPFFFFIMSKNIRVPIFMGRIVNPALQR